MDCGDVLSGTRSRAIEGKARVRHRGCANDRCTAPRHSSRRSLMGRLSKIAIFGRSLRNGFKFERQQWSADVAGFSRPEAGARQSRLLGGSLGGPYLAVEDLH